MDIRVNVKGSGVSQGDLRRLKDRAKAALVELNSGTIDMTGWVKAPLQQDQAELERLLAVAEQIKGSAELLVVIGIGGSYMGAKAAIEALPKAADGIEVKFAGINLCSPYHEALIEDVKQKETMLCVISKSGNTMEVKAAFDILKAVMAEKYGSAEAAAKRIVAITDRESGALRAEVTEAGYVSFEIPRNIGGRYSALTPAGLLPMAVSGIDIKALLAGAALVAGDPDWAEDGTEYAITRYLMIEQGKQIETIEFYDTRLTYLGEWLKQLYGESEGKEGRGLYPTTLNFSTDLHSMGQFLQQGSQIFFETVVLIDAYENPLVIPQGSLRGMSLQDLNEAAVQGVIAAHRNAGIPIIELHIPKLDAYHYGQLLHFFELTCAVTAMLMDVDPFNQPGVEDYKSEMRKVLESSFSK